jgi:transposase InsO family protein
VLAAAAYQSAAHRCAELPNELWQADITHWVLANRREVEILNILDDHSRLLITSTARTVFKAMISASARRGSCQLRPVATPARRSPLPDPSRPARLIML